MKVSATRAETEASVSTTVLRHGVCHVFILIEMVTDPRQDVRLGWLVVF